MWRSGGARDLGVRFLVLGSCLFCAAACTRPPAERGPAGEPAGGQPILVRWFLFSPDALIPADTDPITQALEKRSNVRLELHCGSFSSDETEFFVNSLIRGEPLADVFPWGKVFSNGMPEPGDICLRLDPGLARQRMPGVSRGVHEAARKLGLDPKAVRDRYLLRDEKLAVIPGTDAATVTPWVAVWRKDVLDALAKEVPRTIQDWEGILEAYHRAYPDRTAWQGPYYELIVLYAATGLGWQLIGDWGVERDGRRGTSTSSSLCSASATSTTP